MREEQRADATRFPRVTRALQSVQSMRVTRERTPASSVAEQLAYLERDVQEVRTRVNALFFTVLTAAVGQLVAGLFG